MTLSTIALVFALWAVYGLYCCYRDRDGLDNALQEAAKEEIPVHPIVVPWARAGLYTVHLVYHALPGLVITLIAIQVAISL